MSNLKPVAEKLSQPVVPRSHRRRGISHVLYCRARFLAEFILSVRPPVGGSIAPETSVCLYAESTTYVKFPESEIRGFFATLRMTSEGLGMIMARTVFQQPVAGRIKIRLTFAPG